MKKHLIAAAVAAAVAVPAMAQNVSIYGLVELGLDSSKTTANVSTSTINTGSFGSPQVGIRGEEDLGGGMKAFFRLESGLNYGSGVAGTSAGATFFNRGSEVGLSGAFGRVAIGKLDHQGIENNELSLMGNRGLFNSAEVAAAAAGARVEISSRASDLNDTFSYTTPTMNGISVNVMFTPNDDGSATYAGSNATTHAGVSSAQIAGTIGNLSFKAGTGTLKELAGTKVTVRGVAASYDFGAFKASVQTQSLDNPAGTNDVRETVIQATAPLGNDLTAGVAYSTQDEDNVTTNDYKTATFMLRKDLSKRTALIGMYRTQDPGLSTANAGRTTALYVQHSF